jgi:hypothetical protein
MAQAWWQKSLSAGMAYLFFADRWRDGQQAAGNGCMLSLMSA